MSTGNIRAFLSPAPFTLLNNTTVNSIGSDCLGFDYLTIDVASTSEAWTANQLTFIPLVTAERVLVSRFFWINGATVNGNTDIGIYNEAGTVKLGSTGSTLNAGTNVLQSVDVADFYLPENSRLWLALGSDSGTQTYRSVSSIAEMQDFVGIKQQASGWSSGLPSSITFGTPTVTVVPHFGFTSSAVI